MKNNIKEFKDKNIVIAIDLDGTLLNNNFEISTKSINILKLAKEKYKIIIATGRMFKSAKEFHSKIGLTTPIVCYNGAMIVFNEEIKFHIPVLKNDVINILNTEFKDCRILSFINDELCVEEYDELVKEYCIRANVSYKIVSKEYIIENEVTKFIISGKSELLDKYQFFKCLNSNSLYTPRSKPNYLECINYKVSKASVIKVADEFYNIKKENIIAFGDSYNDVKLLEQVGISVCVKNAPKDIVNICDHICLENSNNGVAEFIKENLL